MKHTLIYISALVLLFGISSCSRQEKELFDQSGTERVEAAMSETAEILTSADNGWVMQYFTNPEGQGHIFLFKFEKNGVVTIAAKNSISTKDVYKSAKSIWALDATQGPVLSMKTYNEVFSVFADPLSDGLGYEGDYEFIVLNANSNQVSLMGKKNRALCTLTPIASTLAWDTYFNPIDQIKDYVINGNDGMQFHLIVDDKAYLPLEYNSMAMTENVQNAYTFPLIVTREGIEFYNEGILTPGNKYAKHFVLNNELTKLLCTDPGVNAYIQSAYTAQEYFYFRLLKNSEWQISKTEHGTTTQAAYDAFVNGIKTSKATFNYMAFTFAADSTLEIHIRFTVNNVRQDGYFYLNTDDSNDQLTITYKSADTNGEVALKRAGGNNLTKGISMLNDIIAGTYKLTSASGSTLNIQQMYMTDVADSDRKIKIFVK